MADSTIDSNEELRARRGDKNANHRFLNLPAELRNRIYTFALPDTDEAFSVRQTGKVSRITRVCRQIRRETLPMLWGQTQFCFLDPSPKAEGAWFEPLPDEAIPLLRHLWFKLPVDCDCDDKQHLRRAARSFHDLKLDIDRSGNGCQSSITVSGIEGCGGGAAAGDPLKKDAPEHVVATKVRKDLLALLNDEKVCKDQEQCWLRKDLIKVVNIVHAAWSKCFQTW